MTTDQCAHCGGSGHKANRCPWRAYREPNYRKTSMKPLLILSVAALVLSGCDDSVRLTEASKTPLASAQAAADSFVYVKARNGLCFGVATQRRVSTAGSLTENVLVVNVSCDAVLPAK